MTTIVISVPDGKSLDLDSLAHSLVFEGINLISDSVFYDGNLYTITYGYTGTNLTSYTQWIKQS